MCIHVLCQNASEGTEEVERERRRVKLSEVPNPQSHEKAIMHEKKLEKITIVRSECCKELLAVKNVVSGAFDVEGQQVQAESYNHPVLDCHLEPER